MYTQPQTGHACKRTRIFRPEHALAGGQRPLKQRFGFCVATLGLIEEGKIVQTLKRIGIVFALQSPDDFEISLGERDHLGIFASLVELGQLRVDRLGFFGIVLRGRRGRGGWQPLKHLPCLGLTALRPVELRQILGGVLGGLMPGPSVRSKPSSARLLSGSASP